MTSHPEKCFAVVNPRLGLCSISFTLLSAWRKTHSNNPVERRHQRKCFSFKDPHPKPLQPSHFYQTYESTHTLTRTFHNGLETSKAKRAKPWNYNRGVNYPQKPSTLRIQARPSQSWKREQIDEGLRWAKVETGKRGGGGSTADSLTVWQREWECSAAAVMQPGGWRATRPTRASSPGQGGTVGTGTGPSGWRSGKLGNKPKPATQGTLNQSLYVGLCITWPRKLKQDRLIHFGMSQTYETFRFGNKDI